MKLQIDTKEKTIGIVEDVSLQELNEFIRLAIPESEYRNWKIKTIKEVVQTPPIIIEKWKEQQWRDYYPWWENPIYSPTTQPSPWFGITDPTTGQPLPPQYQVTCFTMELR